MMKTGQVENREVWFAPCLMAEQVGSVLSIYDFHILGAKCV